MTSHFLSRFPDLTTGVLTCNWGDTGQFIDIPGLGFVFPMTETEKLE